MLLGFVFWVMFFNGLYHSKTPSKHHLREYTFGFSKHLKQSQGYIFFLPTDPLRKMNAFGDWRIFFEMWVEGNGQS